MISFVRLGTATLVAAVAVAGISGSAWAGKAHSKSFNYSLSTGTCTGAETVPLSNQPVQVIGSQITAGYRGVGQVTLIAIPSNFLEWVGSDIYTNSVTSGFSSTAGGHVVYLDYDGHVDLEVASDTQVKVCSASGGTATGTVTFIY